MQEDKLSRRPLKTRQTVWANSLAKWLLKIGITPNQVSISSMVFSLFAGISFLLTDECSRFSARLLFYLLAALFIQLRLLANMLDGMLAIEGGLKSKWGDIYNEVPDRFSDTLILVGAGYSLSGHQYMLGWAAALLAILTVYIRLFGVSIGTPAFYSGPMAKPHRMFTLTVFSVMSSIGLIYQSEDIFISIGLWIIIVGSAVTFIRRLAFIVENINQHDR